MTYSIQWQAGAEGALTVSALVHADVDLSQWDDSAIFSPIQELADLAAHGGMSGMTKPPWDAQCTVVRRIRQGRTVQWVLELSHQSSLLLDGIEGALMYFDESLGTLDSVEVVAPSSLLAARASEPEGHYPSLPFVVVDDRQLFQGGFDFTIELANPQPEDVLEKIEGASFAVWFCAGSSGSFCNPGYPPDVTHFFMEDPDYEPSRLTFSLDGSTIPEPHAIQSLLNVLAWTHHHVAKIKQVELFEQ